MKDTGSLLFHAGNYEVFGHQQRYRFAVDRHKEYASAQGR